uniref:Uncharacterized protein n=1 Tax=Trichuris muris TaxID=70415 RepID=A0A5S6QTE0_TRIMR
MSCSSEVAFPPLGTGNVEEPSWLGDKPTSFESYIANFINLLQPLELPLDRLVDINATENGVTVKPTVSVGALLQLAKDYEIPIIATAALPFLLLLLSKLCCSLFCLLTCMCNGTGKPKKRPLAATLLFLLFSGAMLNAAVYTLMSSYALNSKINNLPYEIAKSVNYIPTYANVTKEMLDRLLANDFDLLLQHMRDISLTSDCILEKAFIDKGFEHPNDIMTTFSWKYKTTREYQKILSQCASSADTCESQTKGLSSSITKINTSAGAAALKAIGMVEQASDSITEVRSIAKGLISSLHYVEDAIGKILEYRPQFEKYNSYRVAVCAVYGGLLM